MPRVVVGWEVYRTMIQGMSVHGLPRGISWRIVLDSGRRFGWSVSIMWSIHNFNMRVPRRSCDFLLVDGADDLKEQW